MGLANHWTAIGLEWFDFYLHSWTNPERSKQIKTEILTQYLHFVVNTKQKSITSWVDGKLEVLIKSPVRLLIVIKAFYLNFLLVNKSHC